MRHLCSTQSLQNRIRFKTSSHTCINRILLSGSDYLLRWQHRDTVGENAKEFKIIYSEHELLREGPFLRKPVLVVVGLNQVLLYLHSSSGSNTDVNRLKIFNSSATHSRTFSGCPLACRLHFRTNFHVYITIHGQGACKNTKQD